MGKLQVVVAALAMAGVAQAVPTIDAKSVTFEQKGAKRAKITYSLTDAPAIVTVDIRTNGVSIGAANFTSLAGDVNKLVTIDGTHTLTWNVYEDWPDCKITDRSLTAVVTAWSPSYPPDYMAADLSGTKDVSYYVSAEALPGGVSNDLYKTDKLLMRKIHACNKTFRMGAPTKELGNDPWTEQPHIVVLTNDFWIGVYPITQRQRFLACGNLDGCTCTDRPDSPMRPANGGSFKTLYGDACHSYATRPSLNSLLMKMRDVTGLDLDAPTEAQWEFACRAGVGTSLYSGWDIEDVTTSDRLDAIGWYDGNSDGETHPVGLKAPNAFGLFDLQGNVAEVVKDGFADNLPSRNCVNPLVTDGNGQVFKGGSFADTPKKCRISQRWSGSAVAWGAVDPSYGARCAMTIR